MNNVQTTPHAEARMLLMLLQITHNNRSSSHSISQKAFSRPVPFSKGTWTMWEVGWSYLAHHKALDLFRDDFLTVIVPDWSEITPLQITAANTVTEGEKEACFRNQHAGVWSLSTQSNHNLLSSLGLFLDVAYSGLGLTCHTSVYHSVKQVFNG